MSDVVNNLKVLSFKKKILFCAGVIGILGIGYNAYHWFDGLTQNRIGYLYGEGIIVKKDFITFNIQTKVIENKIDNVIIVTQSNSMLNMFEPEEIYLYQEKVS